jgi:hypothetical protein
MIKLKKKICKDCKEEKYLFRRRKCKSCYQSWLLSTDEGNKELSKYVLKASITIKKTKKIELKKRKKDLFSSDEYRSKYVQPIINEIARLIDYGQPCIATGSYNGKMNGGHFHSTGSNRTLTLNLHNIHLQSYASNCPNGGDNLKYREGIKRIYGQDYLDYVESLKSIAPLHLSKDDLYRIEGIAKKIRIELKNNLIVRTAEERIRLREKINNRIGIYEKYHQIS